MNLEHELAALARRSPAELRDKYAELFGEPTRCRNRTWLVRRIAWRLQMLAEGDLTARARQRAAQLAQDADLRVVPPRAAAVELEPRSLTTRTDPRLPPPGSVLVKTYKGVELRVRVLDGQFEHDGRTFKTLTAVARAISGSHVNGFSFFGLGGKR